MSGDWAYTPSCPCDRCEDYREANGMSCLFGLGPRPEQERPHHQLDLGPPPAGQFDTERLLPGSL